ncbi:hypothetical protein [Calorimonas adulescens]|uniref:Uncharacterized protein n=1 Tax=Calorimonas adulescens TaxID=2606906 RepID=A0A5D8QEN4_9THEO|nr:hypothetical protein [Calorimonas adulescens]TZE82629.1 hypothetical protein FWJ32_04975 [Calorimonas adulescens]
MNQEINIQQFQEQMEKGCWVLADASNPMKHYTAKNNLDVRQYRTPQKFIKQREEIIIVSISKEL